MINEKFTVKEIQKSPMSPEGWSYCEYWGHKGNRSRAHVIIEFSDDKFAVCPECLKDITQNGRKEE